MDGSVETLATLTGKLTDIKVPVIDKTLTQEGQAADAKAVGDALNGLVFPEGIGQEVLTLRADFDNHTHTAEDVGARPNTWMPTASQVGARPDTWMPTASDVGAPTIAELNEVKDDLTNHANAKNPHGTTASDVGALSINGGEVNGGYVRINGNGYSSLYITDTELERSLRSFIGGATAGIENWQSDANRVMLILNTENASIKDLLDLTLWKNGVTSSYKLFGEHNKPSGSYTGNGSATKREIYTGGHGGLLIVWSTVYGSALVTPNGAVATSTGVPISGEGASYPDGYGTLTLNTTNNTLNASGVTYWYRNV